jgi:hypothetical protein
MSTHLACRRISRTAPDWGRRVHPKTDAVGSVLFAGHASLLFTDVNAAQAARRRPVEGSRERACPEHDWPREERYLRLDRSASGT